MSSSAARASTLALAILAVTSMPAWAGTAEEKALEHGGEKLNSEEIAERLVGKTVTFEAGDKTFLVHYGKDNTVAGKLIGGDWSDTGIYGVTMADRICLSWNKSDEGRLRCMTVIATGGILKKFNADGSYFGDIVAFEEGKNF